MKLVPLEKAAKIVHKWPPWIPWVTFGGGMVVAGFGGAFKAQGFSQMSDFDKAVSSRCQTSGCKLSDFPDLQAQKDRATRFDTIGTVVLSVGAAGAVAGVVLLV